MDKIETINADVFSHIHSARQLAKKETAERQRERERKFNTKNAPKAFYKRSYFFHESLSNKLNGSNIIRIWCLCAFFYVVIISGVVGENNSFLTLFSFVLNAKTKMGTTLLWMHKGKMLQKLKHMFSFSKKKPNALSRVNDRFCGKKNG